MTEARRTLRCWLLAAFLERGCDPLTARLPETVPRARPLSAADVATLRRRRPVVEVLPRRAPASAAPPPVALAVVLPFRRAGA